jgi:hypothetical protein
MKKLQNFVPDKQKTLENPFQTIFGNIKHYKKMTFVSCFVKLLYFAASGPGGEGGNGCGRSGAVDNAGAVDNVERVG